MHNESKEGWNCFLLSSCSRHSQPSARNILPCWLLRKQSQPLAQQRSFVGHRTDSASWKLRCLLKPINNSTYGLITKAVKSHGTRDRSRMSRWSGLPAWVILSISKRITHKRVRGTPVKKSNRSNSLWESVNSQFYLSGWSPQLPTNTSTQRRGWTQD